VLFQQEQSGGTTTPSGTTACEGINQYIGDGYCDDINNNLACTYEAEIAVDLMQIQNTAQNANTYLE
jgi:hypothetical protein